MGLEFYSYFIMSAGVLTVLLLLMAVSIGDIHIQDIEVGGTELPVFSLKSLAMFCAGFGTVGFQLTTHYPNHPVVIFLAATMAGLSGVAVVVAILLSLRKLETDDNIDYYTNEYLSGVTGIAVLSNEIRVTIKQLNKVVDFRTTIVKEDGVPSANQRLNIGTSYEIVDVITSTRVTIKEI